MRLRFLVVSLLFVLTAGTGYAQTFTGTIDGYWSYNTNTPNFDPSDPLTGLNLERRNPYRAFDVRDQSFALQYGEIAIDYKPNNVGFRADIGFGDAADIVNSSGSATWRHIQQAYITATKDKFTFDFGKFVTPLGAEVIETKDNWNYTRGLLFTWAIPFTHLGGRATYVASDKVTLAGYLVNGWDNVNDENTAKSIGFVGTFKPASKFTIVTNYLTGKEGQSTDNMRQMFDGVLTIALHDRLTLMGNYDYGQDKAPNILPGVSGPEVNWQAAAGYAKVKAHDNFILSGRYEWFDDKQGFRTGTLQELQSGTITGQIPVSDVTIWAEYRKDWSNQSVFNKTTEGIFGPVQSLVDSQSTFTLGLTYAFTKEVK